jgi:hypothetical protein
MRKIEGERRRNYSGMSRRHRLKTHLIEPFNGRVTRSKLSVVDVREFRSVGGDVAQGVLHLAAKLFRLRKVARKVCGEKQKQRAAKECIHQASWLRRR